MPAKKHTFEIDALSAAIDKIVVQGSKVFINFSGNEKTYEYEWKPANKTLLAKLNGFVEDPTSLSLGRFYNDSLKSGDLVQKPFNQTKGTKHGKVMGLREKEQKGFFQPKEERIVRI